MRTHTCGELNLKDVGNKVSLCGWVDAIRTHGGVSFVSLRDRFGVTQIVMQDVSKIKNEYVIKIDGSVRERPSKNKNIPTGEIEVECKDLEILNTAEPLPLDISGKIESSDETRLKYRYLDLRQKKNMDKMVIRHKATMATHEFMNKHNFLYIETPLLIRATPEGARDFVVPSRLHPGTIYSLPQSPQLYKQISMVAGFDRYYQLAKCLRDEDLRQDRQPEFTQIDFEMSFVKQEDVMKISEGLAKHIFEKVTDKKIQDKIPKITYEESIRDYGIDRPDMRFDMKLVDITSIGKSTDFKVFNEAELIKAIVAPKEFSRKECDKLTEFVKIYKAKGLVYLKYDGKKLDGPVAKFIDEKSQKELIKLTKIKKEETMFIVADSPKICNDSLANLRVQLGEELNLYDKNELKFVWVTDFPLFEWDEDNKRWSPMHHIFSMPREDLIKHLDKNPELVTGYLYDLVLNGTELGGGSIRIHRKDIQEKVLEVIGMDYKDAEERFGFLLDSFRYGAPPHGGFAFGFDRLVAVLAETKDIREVMAYPKNKSMECPMDGCPSKAEKIQLEELHMKFI